MKELCTVEDVLAEGCLTNKDSDFQAMIRYKIENLSMHIHQISTKDLENNDNVFCGRMACIYGVLAWLESKNMIPSSQEISSLHEGGVSISYKNPSKTNTSHDYNSQYHYYKSYLTSPPPVGNHI